MIKGIFNFIKQLIGFTGAFIAAACILGVPYFLTLVGRTAGLGFLIRDDYLFPIFILFLIITLWFLYTSSRNNGRLMPFLSGLLGSMVAVIGLWLLVTGATALPWVIYPGLLILILSIIWNLGNSRYATLTAITTSLEEQSKSSLGRRATKGLTVSVAAAAVFYGMYKTVGNYALETSKVEHANISCWGVNSCKGQSTCASSKNSCSGQNTCKGKGLTNLSEKKCYGQGGQPLEGSPADPSLMNKQL